MILEAVYNRKATIADDLAFLLNVSVRTIKSDVKSLKRKLNTKAELFLSKSGEGYQIAEGFQAEIETLIETSQKRYFDQGMVNLEDRRSRIVYIFYLLLIDYRVLRLADLSSLLYLSDSAIKRDLRIIEQILVKYHLTLIQDERKRLEISGAEKDIRNLLFDLFDPLDFERKLPMSYQAVVDKLLVAVKQTSMEFSNYALNALAKYFLIMKHRENMGQTFHQRVRFEDQEVTELVEQFLTLMKEDQPAFSSYMYLHFSTKRIYLNKQVFEQVEDFVSVMELIAMEIRITFDIDIQQDPDIFELLSLHIVGVIQRARVGLSAKNTIEYKHLRKYLLGVKITISMVEILERLYKIKIDLDEFTLLVYYLNVIIRKQQKLIKKTIGLLRNHGRSEDLMYYAMLSESFFLPKYEVVPISDLNTVEEFDIVVADEDILIPGQSSVVLASRETDLIEKIRHGFHILTLREIPLHEYFSPQNFVHQIAGKNKEEVLANVLSLFEQYNYLYPEVNEYNLREIELGNGAVMFQDTFNVIKKPVFFVGFLESPIYWENQSVMMIVLIKTKKDGDKDLVALNDLLSKWLDNLNEVRRASQDPRYDLFIENLLRISSQDSMVKEKLNDGFNGN